MRHFFGALALWALTAPAHPGVGIVVDGRGNVFYTDLAHGWKRTPGGKRSIFVRNVHTHELFLDVAGNLHGEHLWYEATPPKSGATTCGAAKPMANW